MRHAFLFGLIIISSLLLPAFVFAQSSQNQIDIQGNLMCEDELSSIERAVWEKKFENSRIYGSEQKPNVFNSKNEAQSVDTLFFSATGRGFISAEKGTTLFQPQGSLLDNSAAGQLPIIPNESQKVDAEILIYGEDLSDAKILKIKNLTYKKNMPVGIDKLPLERDYIQGKSEVESYAINLEDINFTIGSLTAVAKGNTLWKCALWNFTTQSCMGTWVVLQSIVPGEEYNISLFPGDPGYVETYDAEESIDIAMTAMGEEMIVIGWINNQTGYSASFEVWNTNGSLITSQIDFETTGSSASRIDIDAINMTHFIISLIDGPDQDLDFFIYDIYGNMALGATQLDATIGGIADTAVCELGDRFAVLVENTGDGDADFYVRDNNGNSLVIQTAVDANTAPGATGQNLVDCVALNDTKWMYLFYDDLDNDVTNALVNGSGTILAATADIDTDVGETGQIAGASFGNNRYAAVFYDSTDQDVSLRISQVTAANTLQIIYTGDIDLTAGLSSRVAATEVRNSAQSLIVAAWVDSASGDIKAAVYNGSGAIVTAPFTITTTESTSYPLLDVTGYSSMMGQGLCNYTFAIAYSNASGSSVFETYWLNGTRWSGTCPRAVESNSPQLSIITPENNTENTTSATIDFIYQVSDASDISNCSLYIDGILNDTNNGVIKDIPQTFSLLLENGQYIWKIDCYDQFGNYNSSGDYNLNVSVFFYSSNAIDIDIDAFDDETIVMAWIEGGTGNYLSFEIWHTNGTRLIDRVDVDTTGDVSSAVSVASLNSSNFVIGWIDGPDNDLSHIGYTRTGQNYFPATDLDTLIGTFADVDVCALGDRYAVVNANQADGDADFRIESNSGANLVLEQLADGTITPGANNQNLVSCSVINQSAWDYAYFDDADNDASMSAFDFSGAALGIAQDIDADVGEIGQVAVAGLRNNSIAYVYYDSVAQQVYATIRTLSGTTWNTVWGPTAIDSNAGSDSRVDVAEVEYFGRSYFVAGWYDNADTTIKAAVYNETGGEVTAPFVVSSNPTASPSILSVTGTHSTLDFGLCRRTFAIAYTNLSGHAVFRTYNYNGTQWDGECPEIASPIIENIKAPASINLVPGAMKVVECNATIDEGYDLSDISSVTGTFFHSNVSESGVPDNNNLYRNSSCSLVSSSGDKHNYTCTFSAYYFAENGSWNCTIKAQNIGGTNGTNTTSITIDPLYAFNTSTLFIDYGDIPPGSNSSDKILNLTNLGNMPVNISLYGYGGDDIATGTGYALRCLNGQNVSLLNERYSLASGRTFAQKTAVSASALDMNFTISKQTAAGTLRINSSYWQMYIPPLTMATQCNGTLVFTATAP